MQNAQQTQFDDSYGETGHAGRFLASVLLVLGLLALFSYRLAATAPDAPPDAASELPTP